MCSVSAAHVRRAYLAGVEDVERRAGNVVGHVAEATSLVSYGVGIHRMRKRTQGA